MRVGSREVPRVPTYHKPRPDIITRPSIPTTVPPTIRLNAPGSSCKIFGTFMPYIEPMKEPNAIPNEPMLMTILAYSKRFRTASNLWLMSSCVVSISPLTKSKELVRENAVCRCASRISSGSSDSGELCYRETVTKVK